MKLFLDDIRYPKDCFAYTKNPVYNENNWFIVRNYTEFIDVFAKFAEEIKLVSFDHDLGEEHYASQSNEIAQVYQEMIDCPEKIEAMYDIAFKERTGYDCAKWMIGFCILDEHKLPKILCHSMNPVGKQNILNLFK